MIVDNTHKNEGPGVVYNSVDKTNNDREDFFCAKVNDELRHSNSFRCNDTSTTVSYSPKSKLENLVLNIEQTLNSGTFKEGYPYIGTDIKVMGIRKYMDIEITTCVPLIAKYIVDSKDYFNKLEIIRGIILEMATREFPNSQIKLTLNSRDNVEKDDLYLTAIGSAIESGDEGVVGRGNRSRGVIPFARHFSMEAACGKNPIYHTGKLFTAIGDVISDEICRTLGLENVVYCTSKMGDDILNPWNISVELNVVVSDETRKLIESIVEQNIRNHSLISEDIIYRRLTLNSY